MVCGWPIGHDYFIWCLEFGYWNLTVGAQRSLVSAPALGQEGDVATNKERLLSRPRVGERAGPAVQMEVGNIPVFKLVIGHYVKFETC